MDALHPVETERTDLGTVVRFSSDRFLKVPKGGRVELGGVAGEGFEARALTADGRCMGRVELGPPPGHR